MKRTLITAGIIKGLCAYTGIVLTCWAAWGVAWQLGALVVAVWLFLIARATQEAVADLAKEKARQTTAPDNIAKTWNAAYPDRRPWDEIGQEAQAEWRRIFVLYEQIKVAAWPRNTKP